MTYLVGDIGGTNTRLALADNTGVHTSTFMRARNDDFASFDAVLARYLATHEIGRLQACCIAIAGPVQAGSGQLTNRNWTLQADQLAQQTGATRAALINDLSALGYALPRLSPQLLSGAPQVLSNGQALVVGMGTGFNVSMIKNLSDGTTVVFEAELGHAELPASVAALLHREIGASASVFVTVEDCFCGPGLEHLHHKISGQNLSGHDIMAGFDSGTDVAATKTVTLFARALGLLTHTMIHQYLPRDGLVFAGSVARSMLASAALPAFTSALSEPGKGVVNPHSIPVSVITDDAAALQGCLAHLIQTS